MGSRGLVATAAALASSTERETDKSTKYDDKPWKFQRVAVVNFAAWELYCGVKKAVVWRVEHNKAWSNPIR